MPNSFPRSSVGTRNGRANDLPILIFMREGDKPIVMNVYHENALRTTNNTNSTNGGLRARSHGPPWECVPAMANDLPILIFMRGGESSGMIHERLPVE